MILNLSHDIENFVDFLIEISALSIDVEFGIFWVPKSFAGQGLHSLTLESKQIDFEFTWVEFFCPKILWEEEEYEEIRDHELAVLKMDLTTLNSEE